MICLFMVKKKVDIKLSQVVTSEERDIASFIICEHCFLMASS